MARKPRERGGTNLCFDCKKACGGCSWSEWDAVNKKPKFQPVEGWKAIKVPYFMNGRGGGLDCTYYITDCPEFESDERTEVVSERFCTLCGKLIIGEHIGSRKHCFKCVPKNHYYDRTTGEVRLLKRYRRGHEND